MRLPADPLADLQRLHRRFQKLRRGEVQASMPGVRGADPDTFAIALATVDGTVLEVGDTGHSFSLQSISKPFIYGMALDRLGREIVHTHVAVEPTGEAFNSLVELEEDRLPYNPMVNSGAIAISAMLHHANPRNAARQVMAGFGAWLGRRAALHPDVKDLDAGGSYRNKAIAHLLRHFEVIGDDIDGALRLYGRQCAIDLTVSELALMGATLANGGVHPRTRRLALSREHVADVLTLMFTCGMYDTSGTWAWSVGLPAKSGVSGGIVAVVPGHFGLAVFSPRLDAHGHSVRGVEVMKDWSARWRLGIFERG